METINKQPYEAFTISTDFGSNFASGEAIVLQDVVAVDRFGIDATAAIIEADSVASNGASTVSALLSGGDEAHSPYKITFRCATSVGHRWEYDVQLRVREV